MLFTGNMEAFGRPPLSPAGKQPLVMIAAMGAVQGLIVNAPIIPGTPLNPKINALRLLSCLHSIDGIIPGHQCCCFLPLDANINRSCTEKLVRQLQYLDAASVLKCLLQSHAAGLSSPLAIIDI